MNARGLLLAVGILVAFLALFVPLARRIDSGRDLTIDAERLRRTYVALALYESAQGGPAPNLGLVMRDVDPGDLRSVGDPTPGAPSYPLDPALPSLALRSPTRVSWSYRWHWREAGRPGAVDPRTTLLADPWLGPVLRVNADGSLVEGPSASALTFAALFGR